jgi:hypothetical protein
MKQAPGEQGNAISTDLAQSVASRLKLEASIVETEEQLPQHLRDQIEEEGAQGEVRGVFDSKTGKVYLVRANLKSEGEAIFVALHESAHRGLQKLFGDDLRPILGHIYLTNENVRKQARELMDKYGYDQARATEEVLADMATRGQAHNLKGWERFVAFLKKWLVDRGFNIEVSDAMAEFIAGAAAEAGKQESHVFAKPEAAKFHLAYHGSPHDFERFDVSKIGSGEGVQAFGYGLYFAGKREVAEHYRDKLSQGDRPKFTKDGRTLSTDADIAKEYFRPGRIVDGYGGPDRVLEFKKSSMFGGDWSVKVVHVARDGSAIPSERPRWHSTFPDPGHLKLVLVADDGWKEKKPGPSLPGRARAEGRRVPRLGQALRSAESQGAEGAGEGRHVARGLPRRPTESGESIYHAIGWGACTKASAAIARPRSSSPRRASRASSSSTRSLAQGCDEATRADKAAYHKPPP